MPPSGTSYTGVTGKKTICICPRCGEEHTFYIDWQGRGTPKKFCVKCQYLADECSGSLDNCFEFRARAISGRR
jgi:Zn ribbon nucleic-acid-binding protein